LLAGRHTRRIRPTAQARIEPIVPKLNRAKSYWLSGGGAEKVKERCMRSRLPHCFLAAVAVCVLLPVAAQAQVIAFAGNFGPGLAPSDNQMLFESVARLNAT